MHFECSNDDHTLLAVRMSSGHTTLTHISGYEFFIESICVWVVDVVVDTSLVVVACWLPELLNIGTSVVVIEEELRGVTDEEQAEIVGLETSIEGLEV